MQKIKDSIKNLPVKDRKPLFIIPLVFLFIALTFIFSQPNSSKAFFECYDCGCEWEFDCCEDCPRPSPCEPSPTPTPTPTADPTPTPTPSSPTNTPTPSPSGNGDRGGPGPAGPPVCGASTPDAPYLKSAIYLGGDSVELKWDPVANATHYTISYGSSSGDYPWGVPNTGNQTSYIIDGISKGCFIAYAVNDCAPSDPSNEVCTGQAQGMVLGLSSTSSKDDSFLFSLGLLMIASGVIVLGKEIYTLR